MCKSNKNLTQNSINWDFLLCRFNLPYLLYIDDYADEKMRRERERERERSLAAQRFSRPPQPEGNARRSMRVGVSPQPSSISPTGGTWKPLWEGLAPCGRRSLYSLSRKRRFLTDATGGQRPQVDEDWGQASIFINLANRRYLKTVVGGIGSLRSPIPVLLKLQTKDFTFIGETDNFYD